MTERKKEHSISVVIPAYNAEKYLAQCLDSVLAQTILPEEIIVVDDGSQDRSIVIAKEYQQRHVDLITVLQHPEGANKGASASRNLGFTHASGTHIAFLDADDIWHKEKLEIQRDAMASHPEVSVFFARAKFIDSHGSPTDVSGFTVVGKGTPGVQMRFFESLLRENPIVNSTTVVMKNAIIRAGMFSEEILSYEDWLMWLKIASFGTFYFTETVLVSYRVHSEGKLLASRRNRIGAQREVQLISDLYAFLRSSHTEEQDNFRRHLPYSVSRILYRARSLHYSVREMHEVRDALLDAFPEMRERIIRLTRFLCIVPSSFFAAARIIRRRIVKV